MFHGKALEQTLAVARAKYRLPVLSLFSSQLAPKMPQASKNGVGSRRHPSPPTAPVLSITASPFCVQASVHAGLGTGIFFATILIVGAAALAAYSYFRLNRRTIGFQHFEVRERNMGAWWWGALCTPAPGSGLLQLTSGFTELTQ